MSELPRGDETLERNDARAWMAARGFKQADIDRELPAAENGTLAVTKRGILRLHKVTAFEFARAGGQIEED